MTVALLSVGNELLRGETANTNAQWLGEQLTSMGYDVIAIETVADDSPVIVASLRRILGETDLVLVTGGLGPTSDDLTAAAAAEAFGTQLTLHHDLTEREIELVRAGGLLAASARASVPASSAS